MTPNDKAKAKLLNSLESKVLLNPDDKAGISDLLAKIDKLDDPLLSRAAYTLVSSTQMRQQSIQKALPKKDAETKSREGEKKDRPKSKASSKKAGAGGKTRYEYPGEKKGGKGKKPSPDRAEQREPEEGSPADGDEAEQGPVQSPVKADLAAQRADPQQFAQQVGMEVGTLKKIALKFRDKKELKGRAGFQDFMMTQLKTFVKKHKQIDRDYFGLLYDGLIR